MKTLFDDFETTDEMDDPTYARRESRLRADLLDVQYEILQRRAFPVLLLVNGVEGAGKGETVNLLNEWMDPRHMRAVAFARPTKDERARPEMWRFWRALPENGRIGIFFGSWYTHPITARVEDELSDKKLDEHIAQIVALEELLEKDGTLLVKTWFHLGKKAQEKRLLSLEKDKRTRWRVTEADWRRYRHYDEYKKTCDHVLRQTQQVPWHVINGHDPNLRALAVGELLLSSMKKRLAEQDILDQASARAKKVASHTNQAKKVAPPPVPPVSSDHLEILRRLKFEDRLGKEHYEVQLEKEQRRLNELSRNKKFLRDHSCVIVFEGNDAAGKGGAVRRITAALDARQYHVIPVAAPSPEEKRHPYLWRFWRELPPRGIFTVFDRSWYGRVLVERVEGFARVDEWQRAYHEIEAFEKDMIDAGIIVVKFWLAVTKEEQLRRFKERENKRFKQFKITEEDWRNRKKWSAYEAAACDMIAKTSAASPWNVIEANDKHLARIKILKAIGREIEEVL